MQGFQAQCIVVVVITIIIIIIIIFEIKSRPLYTFLVTAIVPLYCSACSSPMPARIPFQKVQQLERDGAGNCATMHARTVCKYDDLDNAVRPVGDDI
jgi:hypothetical protein